MGLFGKAGYVSIMAYEKWCTHLLFLGQLDVLMFISEVTKIFLKYLYFSEVNVMLFLMCFWLLYDKPQAWITLDYLI